jgi:hypothetical protein
MVKHSLIRRWPCGALQTAHFLQRRTCENARVSCSRRYSNVGRAGGRDSALEKHVCSINAICRGGHATPCSRPVSRAAGPKAWDWVSDATCGRVFYEGSAGSHQFIRARLPLSNSYYDSKCEEQVEDYESHCTRLVVDLPRVLQAGTVTTSGLLATGF